MIGRGQLLSWCAGAAIVVAVAAGCQQQGSSQGNAASTAHAATATKVSLEGRRDLAGGDRHAWLTTAGNISDNNYCREKISFPLDTERAWEYTFTSAQFSSSAVNSLIHYDGLVVAAARSSQLVGLKADTGELVFNQDVYLHLDNHQQEILSTIFFHPRGLLTGLDDLGRIYCWEVTADGLQQQWITEADPSTRAMITQGPGLYAGWGNMMHSLAIADGSELWSYPNLSGDNGVVMSDSGLLITWTQYGEFYCLDGSDGRLLWSVFTDTTGRQWATRVVIDNERSRAYLILPDERVQCRDLPTSDLLWEHSWTDLLPMEDRPAHFATHNADLVPLWSVECCLSPAGLTLAMLHGQAININHDGERTWTYDSDVLLLGEMAFDNAILLTEWYLGLDYPQINPGWRSFSPAPPVGWERFDAADEGRQSYGTFQRFVWLDPANGTVIDMFEPDFPANAIVPAGDKIVIGESYRDVSQVRRILAYNWLAPEEN